MTMRSISLILLAVLAAVPLFGPGNYPLHLMVMGLLWGFIYTSWSIMGRLGMVSFGHGAFLGIGAYTVVLLWNLWGISPWIGALVALVITVIVAVMIGYPCFRFKIVGHYFALTTLALSEVVRLIIVGLRDQTGGSLGITPKNALPDGVTTSDERPAVLQQGGLVLPDAGVLARCAVRVAPGRPQHEPDGAGGDQRGRGCRGVGGHQREPHQALDHRAVGGDDLPGRRALRAVPAVRQSRDRVRHRHLAADGVRRDRRRHVRDAGPHGGRGVPDAAVGRPARADRQRRARHRHHDLRSAADPVHHLHAQGHPGHRAGEGAGRRRR